MTTLYKLTDKRSQTYNGTQWGPSITHTTDGEGGLCGPGWLHAYTSPLLAVLLNPIHANFANPQLWEAEGVIGKSDNGLKVGTTKLTTIRQIELPEVTTEQRVRFAILAAKQVCKAESWNEWADNWLSGKDRTGAAAWAAEAAAEAAALAAARAAAGAAGAARAARAAEAAAKAAEAAARAAAEAAAESAAEAARAAVEAAKAARAAKIDLISLAAQAITETLQTVAT